MKAVALKMKTVLEDLVSLTKICGAVLLLGILMGGFRHISSGALGVFY